jgi:hypothetical protein
MPIKPENKHRYPRRKVWLSIRADILKRAENRCEFCGVEDRTIRNHARIVLSVAHLDQQPENNDPQNLKALCQKCHINHDRPFSKLNRQMTFFIRRTSFNHDIFGFNF